jgi:hypothetical protein
MIAYHVCMDVSLHGGAYLYGCIVVNSVCLMFVHLHQCHHPIPCACTESDVHKLITRLTWVGGVIIHTLVHPGTPTPATAGGSDAAHLQPLLQFLHCSPWAARSAWDAALRRPLAKRSEWARRLLLAELQHWMIRWEEGEAGAANR